MNTQTTRTMLTIFVVAAALALVTGVTVASISSQALAQSEKQGGPRAQGSLGQCKQQFNDNVCKKFFP
jgi:uncharacterized membrane protein